ncbi:FtsX-like permease family protein [Pseudovibrio sp. Tun.PSC04-5.I4]|uniref:ABC transporter permease n=1 Tax=Pseudovibrio sp. Tun.PSC04-5.I4 TaxID=1798213 RepID=UPI000891CC0D|nr:FtsX-like permease family protein [Pseudovibrio sp. Tun.PSC04-5.I4]SDR47060.1 putative ABC transport system permease protein [Pseudovibrio sp. Tun.PSC04-5.I4]
MASKLTQSVFIAVTNIKSISRRIWISASMIFSIAMVVIVLIGFLAMARGFEATLEGAGSSEVGVVLAGGARDETGSSIPSEIRHRLSAGILGLTSQNGQPLISNELVVPVDLPLIDGGDLQTISLRGMDAIGTTLRKNVTLVSGRFAEPGVAEIVVGADIARRYAGLNLGQTVEFGSVNWKVVGQFEAGGSAFESEMWADLAATQALFMKEGEVQSLRIGLDADADTQVMAAVLEKALGEPVIVITEQAYFAGQSRRVAKLIRLFGWPIAIVMAIGATAGALNTMFSSVSDRAVEIATLRAIGFSGVAAFVGTWVEALLLSLIGAGIGGITAFLLFNGYQSSTQGAGGQIAFDLQVTWYIVGQAGALALVVGFFGGAFPAFKAARMPIVKAMRGAG